MINRLTKGKILNILLCIVLTAAAAVSWAVLDLEDASAAVDLSRQNASGDTATIKMGKILTSAQDNKFPAVTDFSYTLERIKAWDNSNVSSSKNGTDIARQDIPMPAASSQASHNISVEGDSATVAIGNFMTDSENDSATEKSRYTDVPIKFTKAGYYLYKIKEIDSAPASVPGVTYDTHEYFITVYVANKMDSSGNTIDGVYVHSITAYRNNSGSDTYKPELSDIAKTTDNRGVDAVQNNEENLGKVGLSTSASPNILNADNMWNDFSTSDLVITNNVQGTLGDRTKEFEFDVVLTGLENAKGYKLSGNVSVDSVTTGTYDAQTGTITTTAQGDASFRLKIKDDEEVRIEALNATSKYTVSETANNHIPSYAIPAEGGQSAVIAKAADHRESDNMELSTVQETVDQSDKDQTVAFQNKRDLATLTGSRKSMLGVMTVTVLLLLAGAVVVMIRRLLYEKA